MATLWLRSAARSVTWWQACVVVVAATVTAVVAALPAGAMDDGPDPRDPPPVRGCLSQVRGSMWAWPVEVIDGQSTTVHWGVSYIPSGCTGVTVRATGSGLYSTAHSGSKSLVPIAGSNNNSATYEFSAFKGTQQVPLGNLAVKVNPVSSTAYGRKTIYLTRNSQVQAFLDGIDTPNTTLMLADDLQLNLSGRAELHIKPGVHIIGGRSSTKPGPRLFTTTQPAVLFMIGDHFVGTPEQHPADGVRIRGIRLDGGNMDIGDGAGPIGISVRSSVNVEIGHNEIYGWSGIGVQVLDDREDGRISLENATAVWVHDNYIHHNRHWREEGYGIQSNVGAYTLIERNVFDYNRHAIEASNTDGIGYLAYSNLLFSGGGENSTIGTYTHQFDVHGTSNGIYCGHGPWGYYCGEAGEYFDYRYNTSFYDRNASIKVRGGPDIGADVTQNVFTSAHPGDVIVQTDGTNLHAWNNRVGVVESYRANACDFDGDGQADNFTATGATWWFQGATGQWHYLNTSTTQFGTHDEMIFEDVNHDGRCDVTVTADQTVFSGGRSKRLVGGVEVAARHTDLVWQPAAGTGDATVWLLAPGLASVALEFTVGLAADAQVVGTGDFNADGATDLLVRHAQGQVAVVLLDHEATVIDPIGNRSAQKGVLPWTTQLAGIGDFNADGRADVLWRHADGQLVIWFAGEQGNSAKVSWNNVTDMTGAPAGEPVPFVAYTVKGVGDFNGDGYSDILWFSDAEGKVAVWYMQHAMHIGDAWAGGAAVTPGWQIHGVGDFDADGRADILWRHTEGELSVWFQAVNSSGLVKPTWKNLPGYLTGPEWQVQGVGDFNADGRADIVWRHTTGVVSIWMLNGDHYLGESAPLSMDTSWQLRGVLAQGFQRLDLQ